MQFMGRTGTMTAYGIWSHPKIVWGSFLKIDWFVVDVSFGYDVLWHEVIWRYFLCSRIWWNALQYFINQASCHIYRRVFLFSCRKHRNNSSCNRMRTEKRLRVDHCLFLTESGNGLIRCDCIVRVSADISGPRYTGLSVLNIGRHSKACGAIL